jgi:hypothetical protein
MYDLTLKAIINVYYDSDIVMISFQGSMHGLHLNSISWMRINLLHDDGDDDVYCTPICSIKQGDRETGRQTAWHMSVRM